MDRGKVTPTLWRVGHSLPVVCRAEGQVVCKVSPASFGPASDERLAPDIRRDRDAIRAWLRKHKIAVER